MSNGVPIIYLKKKKNVLLPLHLYEPLLSHSFILAVEIYSDI